MKDDTCGVICEANRQSAFGALRSDTARDEENLKRDRMFLEISKQALGKTTEDTEEHQILFWHANRLLTEIRLGEDRIRVKRALQEWLDERRREEGVPKDAEEALWRYFTRSPNGGF